MPLYPPPASSYGSSLLYAADAPAARTALGIGRGTSFPGSPAAGDIFIRSDRNIEYYYDGTRWLSTQFSTMSFSNAAAAASNLSSWAALPYFGTYSLWLEALDTTMFRSTALPDEWDIVLSWLASNGVATTLATVDGSAHVQNLFNALSTSLGVVLDANARALRVTYTEIDDGGALTAAASVRYRLIG